YLLPTIWAHDQLCDTNALGWPVAWSNNGYSSICSAVNFYQTGTTDTLQWRLQKNYYRYLLARWGSSRAVAGWVGVDEIEGTSGSIQGSSEVGTWTGKLHTY